MLESVHHPWFIRWADSAHRHLEDRGTLLLPLEADDLRRKARARTGLTDFGDPSFQEGLDVLCESAAHDANLSLFGRVMLQRVVVSALASRLRRVELRKTHPEIFDRPLNRPVIVLGLPRSGTTHLHRLLALSPDARALKTWEVREPLAGGAPDLRRLRTSAMIQHIRRTAPALDTKHLIDVDKAEECVFLLEDSMASFSYWMFFPLYRYLDWLVKSDPTPAYEAYREYLQIFQAQSPDKRLVLKAPCHANYVAALHRAIPEATLVHTHRDPVPVMGSVNSLFHTIFSMVSREVDHDRLGETNLEVMAWSMDRSMAERDQVPAEQLIDVRYDALVADPMGTIAGVCEKSGLAFDPEPVQHRVENRPQNRYGRHTYALEETGLTEEGVRTRFAAYRERFDLP